MTLVDPLHRLRTEKMPSEMIDDQQLQVSFTTATHVIPKETSIEASKALNNPQVLNNTVKQSRPKPTASASTINSSLFPSPLRSTSLITDTILSGKMKDASDGKLNFDPSNGVAKEATLGNWNEFADLGLYPALAQHLTVKLNLHQPTPIQRLSLQHFRKHLSTENQSDLIIKAQTGSGKTLAYLLPILDQLLNSTQKTMNRSTSGTLSLILCPTRELAHQVHQQLEQLLSLSYPNRWIVSGLLTGGEKKKSEKARLRKGITVLVATPGRLLDHLKTTQAFKVDQLKWLVMDESDRFEELGFSKSVEEIIGLCSLNSSSTFQTILCSATATEELKEMAGRKLVSPVVLSLDSNAKSSIPNQLKQHFIVVPPKLRLITLCSLLRITHSNTDTEKRRSIVFFSNCDSVDFHFKVLTSMSIKSDDDQDDSLTMSAPIDIKFALKRPTLVYRLHGNISHAERLQTYKHFTSSQSDAILLCTDVAARGLDWPGVQTILQYDPPSDRRDYVHRIGRTARIGQSGDGYLFLQPTEVEYLDRLADLGVVGVQSDLDTVLARGLQDWTPANATVKSVPLAIQKRFRDSATEWQHCIESLIASSPVLNALSRKAFMSSVRAYSTHSADEKDVFHVRKLHLGHLIKSFGMREAPSQIHIGNEKFKVKTGKHISVMDSENSQKKRKGDTSKAFQQSDGVLSYTSAHYSNKLADEFQISHTNMKRRK